MNLKRIIPIAVLGMAVILGLRVYTNRKAPSTLSSVVEITEEETTINMGKNSYEPANIKINVGTKVTFVNETDDYRWPASNLHPSHLIFPEFDPKEALPSGAEWSFIFEKAGEWGYHDHLAPYVTGTIVVVE